ncbi:MAG: endonuclease [Smithella sp.]|nr:endonuclease [Chloroflexota bacterium]
MAKNKVPNRYSRLLEAIFNQYYKEGQTEFIFDRADITKVAEELSINLPKNIGDVLYSFRYRSALPDNIIAKAPIGYEWMIRPAGRAKYKFIASKQSNIVPSSMLVETKILDATPGIIVRYSLNDEQALLAKLRYNRLIDIFTGLTCYSLQNHLRTTIPDGSQIETDEIYVGVDKRGVHYVLPVQAKGGKDRIGIVQIEQDFDMCSIKFPHLICRAIAAKFIDEDLMALFEFEKSSDDLKVSAEKHYRLVKSEELSQKELETYQNRLL